MALVVANGLLGQVQGSKGMVSNQRDFYCGDSYSGTVFLSGTFSFVCDESSCGLS